MLPGEAPGWEVVALFEDGRVRGGPEGLGDKLGCSGEPPEALGRVGAVQ